MLLAQAMFGSGTDFYEYKFIVNKDIDDVAGFYGSDEFMELYSVFPFVSNLMMRQGYFDEDGIVHTVGVPGEMLVSMVFTDEEDEDGKTKWFNKRERFKDVCLGYTCWEEVCNFGVRTLEDGKVEVYHHGEYFVGNLPVVSLIVKLVFQVHARYVVWAVEHHINHYAFTSESEEEEAMEHLSKANHLYLRVKYHFWRDFGSMLGFGDAEINKKEASFLTQDAEEDEEDEEKVELREKLEGALTLNEKFRIENAILQDKVALQRYKTMKADFPEYDLDPEATKDMGSYEMASKSARQRYVALRMATRRKTISSIPNSEKPVAAVSEPDEQDEHFSEALRRYNTVKDCYPDKFHNSETINITQVAPSQAPTTNDRQSVSKIETLIDALDEDDNEQSVSIKEGLPLNTIVQ